MSLDLVKKIITDINQKKIAPIYFLTGEEPYYIDGICNYIDKNVLAEEEKGFNQVILYGKDTTIDDIIAQAKRYPMMAERQVVIVKEAQDLAKTIDQLESYVANPQPSTVLVICYKYKKLDARKKLSKFIKEKGVLFESKKLYDNQVPDWIMRVLAGKGYTIAPKAAQMLTDFLGNDLAKINNELEKLQIIIPKNSEITPAIIEENIGISKDYNNFELQNAIGERNMAKAFSIIQYFGQNPKNNPLIVTVSLLYSFFTKILKYHSLTNKAEASKVLGVNPYFIKDYQLAAKNYPMKNVSLIIKHLREIDLKSKGVGASNISQADLLKELLVKIMS